MDSKISFEDIEEMLLAVNGRIKGLDTDDNEYDSIAPLWSKELTPVQAINQPKSEAELKASETQWYSKAFDYWESDTNCPITDGK